MTPWGGVSRKCARRNGKLAVGDVAAAAEMTESSSASVTTTDAATSAALPASVHVDVTLRGRVMNLKFQVYHDIRKELDVPNLQVKLKAFKRPNERRGDRASGPYNHVPRSAAPPASVVALRGRVINLKIQVNPFVTSLTFQVCW